MFKRFLSVVVGLALFVTMAACGAKQQPEVSSTVTDTTAKPEAVKTFKVGFAIQSLDNQVWAQHTDAFQNKGKEYGHTVVVTVANENVNTQINQLENLITSGCDAIVVNPVDPEAIEDVCKRAMEKGIRIVSWDEEMRNSDVNWLIKNYDLGSKIGEEAAKYINEKYPDKGCEVAVLGYPQTPILLQRENGIKDSLKKLAPKAKVVATQAAFSPTEGLNAMETILQAHPNVKIVATVCGGGAAGANEAFKAKFGPKGVDGVGVFFY